MPNISMNKDAHKFASVMLGDGSDASRRAIGRCELPSAFWPALSRLAIKRLQRTVVHASKLARPPAADPQRRWRRAARVANGEAKLPL